MGIKLSLLKKDWNKGKWLKGFAISSAILLFSSLNAQTGTWYLLNNAAPDDNMGVMLLMTDGTVIAHDHTGQTVGTGWDKLTPDATGSYINGTWTQIASMANDRLFFFSQVMPNGKVVVGGGEYGSGATKAEYYDPVLNTWTATGAVPSNQNIYDGNSEILPNGNTLVGIQNGTNPSYNIAQYVPGTNTWLNEANSPLNHDEAAWLKLPDNSILFVGINSTSSCRYIPGTNSWVADGTVPVNLYDPYGFEAGAAVMLPNGKAIFFGSTGHNAIYTPTGNTSPGTWTTAVDFPKINGTEQTGTVDAPAAMMPNGRILCAASPINTSASQQFKAPTYFFEYNYLTNTFAQVTSPIPGLGSGDSITIDCDFTTFLLLPDGSVLLGLNQTNVSQYYWDYVPSGPNIPQGKPVLNNIWQTACGNTYYMSGKLFNGISEGAAFGDDWQMSTNWPLVRLINGPNVYYCKTANWNRIGWVQTDSLMDTAQFTLPAGLPAGTYTLQVVVNGFPSSNWIFSTWGLTASVVSNVNCHGASTGSAQAIPTGGNPAYTYSWAPSGGTSATATGLSAGTYTVTLKDRLGCTLTASVTITQPATSVSASITGQVNVTCRGASTGSINSSASGGTSPYTYAWSPSGGNAANATGLSAGTYTITVTDNKGCTATASATITQPATGVTVSISSQVNVKCFGNSTGSANSTASGGNTPYTYTWTPSGGNAANATGLSAGTYTITVKDNTGCTATASVNITQPTALSVSIASQVNVKCKGNSTGSINSSVSGGTTAYTYAWTPSGGNAANATGLSAGTYTITVTDANGCTATASATITQPATALGVSITGQTNVNCKGASTGTINSSASGGTGIYTYAWSPSGGNAANATGLSAGTYTITVTDANGCTATASATLTQPATAVSVSITGQVNVHCHGASTGSINSSASGGTGIYTYAWTPSGGNAANATGLSAGTYTITVTDANGCTATASATITQPATGVSVSISSQVNVKCFGNSTGSINSSASGGTSPYTYAWTPSGGNAANATGLSAGTYTITVTDNSGCTATASATITQPAAALSVSIASQVNVKCHGASTGSINSTASGGTVTYTYAWTPSGGNAANATGLSAGTYTITVTDANGCTATASATITQPATALTASITGQVNVKCHGASTGSINSSASGGTGIYTYAWTPSGGNAANATGLTAGTYTITVTDANGCTATASATITQPATALTVTASTTANINCNAGNGGSVHSVPAGGTGTYTYSWSPAGGTGQNATGLLAGSYTITVTDANGCTATASTTVTQPAVLVDSATVTNISCSSQGKIISNTSGGTPAYTYSWSNSATTANITGLSAGTYSLTLTDSHGCSFTASYTITQPAPISANLTINSSVSCNGGSNGKITSAPSGGNSPYTFSWSNSSTNASISNLTAGVYTVTVTDNTGCTATATATITQPNALTLSLTVASNVSCGGGSNGRITSITGGGAPAYTYSWSNGATSANASGLTAGSYTLTVTDNNGCTITASATITQPTPIIDSTRVGGNIVCNGGSGGTAQVTASGGTGTYTYSWSNGATSTSIGPLTGGTYTITVTDANGCTATATATITQPTAINLAQGAINNSGVKTCNGEAWVTATGGTPGYTYSWSPGGATTDTIKGLCKGSYCCRVTDSHGCTDSVCVNVLTGIQNINGASAIKVFPDPNNGYFTISGLSKGQIVEMYDYLGQKLSSVIADNNSDMHVNIVDKPNGVYLVRIITKDGEHVADVKIVKTN